MDAAVEAAAKALLAHWSDMHTNCAGDFQRYIVKPIKDEAVHISGYRSTITRVIAPPETPDGGQ